MHAHMLCCTCTHVYTVLCLYNYTCTTMYTVHGTCTYKSRTSTMYAHVHDVKVPVYTCRYLYIMYMYILSTCTWGFYIHVPHSIYMYIPMARMLSRLLFFIAIFKK